MFLLESERDTKIIRENLLPIKSNIKANII